MSEYIHKSGMDIDKNIDFTRSGINFRKKINRKEIIMKNQIDLKLIRESGL